MITERLLLGHLKHLFQRRVIKLCDKTCALKYIKTYLGQEEKCKFLTVFLGSVKTTLSQNFISSRQKRDALSSISRLEQFYKYDNERVENDRQEKERV